MKTRYIAVIILFLFVLLLIQFRRNTINRKLTPTLKDIQKSELRDRCKRPKAKSSSFKRESNLYTICRSFRFCGC